MKRGYTALEYKSTVQKAARRAARASSISSDFIVGFPGESDDDFERTMALVDDVGFDYSFSFLFSARPGTPAAVAGRRHAGRDQAGAPAAAAGGDRERRATRSAARASARCSACWSRARSRKDDGELMGRTECNRVVNFAAAGRLRRARSSTCGSPRCAATRCAASSSASARGGRQRLAARPSQARRRRPSPRRWRSCRRART